MLPIKLRRLGSTIRGALSRSPQERYESRYALLNGVARRAGFRMYNRNLEWLDDREHKAAWSQFPGAPDDIIKDRKFVLWSMAEATADLAGDTAECGVFDGGSSFLICLSRQQVRTWSGEHHLFDSFDGLSIPEQVDVPDDERAFRWRHHDLAVDEAVALRNLNRFGFVRSHRGWIPDRFDEVADRRFSLVHVDVDLYQPTLASLEFFYPRLVPGGVLLCDDYGFTACPGARRAFDEYMTDKPE